MNRNADPKEFASPDNFGIVDSEMTTTAERRSVKSRAPRRTIGFVTASSIVIANIIGTGIFTSLGFQLADIQSGFPLLLLWFIAGFVSATVGYAAPIALAAMAFGKYVNGVLGFGSPVFLSFAVVWLVALFHLRNLQVGSAFQNLST